MTPLETLKAARDLISDPARWTQNVSARDSMGRPTCPSASEAVCWCALGALGKASRFNSDHVFEVRKLLLKQLGGSVVFIFNDTRTHAEVLALFDAAIAELEATQ